MPIAAGFAFSDCCFSFHEEGKGVVYLEERSPSNNIYCGVPWPLLDPVEQAAVDRCWPILHTDVLGQCASVPILPSLPRVGETRQECRPVECVSRLRRRWLIVVLCAHQRNVRSYPQVLRPDHFLSGRRITQSGRIVFRRSYP